MAHAKRAPLKKITSPKGIAGPFPKVTEVDDYKGEKAYKADLILNPEDEGVAEYLNAIEAAVDSAYDAGIADLETQLETAKGAKIASLKKTIEELEKHTPIVDEYADDGSLTGNKIVKFKRKAAGTFQDSGKSWSHVVPVFDSQKGVIPQGTPVWGGSVLRCQAELMPFCATGLKKAGVSMRLFADQILEIHSGSDAAGGDGFDMEDGYVASAAVVMSDTVETSVDTDEDEDF